MPERNIQETKALLAAGGSSAAMICTVAFSLMPDYFRPWPIALTAVLVSGLSGGITAWALRGSQAVYALLVFLLPVYRLILLLTHHGLPPWPVQGWSWLTGDGFPYWALASLFAAGYAALLARYYLAIAPRSQYLKRPSVGEAGYYVWLDSRVAEADRAELNYRPIARNFLITVVAGALFFTIFDAESDSLLTIALAGAYLALGLYFCGLAYARRMTSAWQEEHISIPPQVEERWWRGYGRYLWPALVFLLLLPGGFRPLNFMALINAIFSHGLPADLTPPEIAAPPAVSMDRMADRIGQAGSPGIIGLITTIALIIFSVIAGLLLLAGALMVLRGLFILLGRWFSGLGPLWGGLQRFISAVLELFKGVKSAGGGVLQRARLRGRGRGDRTRSRETHGRAWPPSPMRRLFANMVIWGRERGLDLTQSMTPREIGLRLAENDPENLDDLAYIVDTYRQERYGEVKTNRHVLQSCREIWEKHIKERGDSEARGTAREGEPTAEKERET